MRMERSCARSLFKSRPAGQSSSKSATSAAPASSPIIKDARRCLPLPKLELDIIRVHLSAQFRRARGPCVRWALAAAAPGGAAPFAARASRAFRTSARRRARAPPGRRPARRARPPRRARRASPRYTNRKRVATASSSGTKSWHPSCRDSRDLAQRNNSEIWRPEEGVVELRRRRLSGIRGAGAAPTWRSE